MSFRYVGLPPSWSTSLASAGFTPEEIADIQARRAAGSLALDLRYLYTERTTSPLVAGFQSAPSAEGPLLSKPSPRSASLPLTESPQPPPMLVTSSSITRRPPPKRKPPLPIENHMQNGHKPNQSSSSTAPQSSDSHHSNQTPPYVSLSLSVFNQSIKQIISHSGQAAPFSSANNSTPHRYPSTSTSNLSSHSGHSTADEYGQTLLAKVSNHLARNDAPSQSSHAAQTDSTKNLTMVGNAPSEFGVAQAGESEDKPRTDDQVVFPKSIWDVKRTLISATKKPSLTSLASSSKATSSSVMPLYFQQQQISQSALSSTSTSFAAAASSSLSTLKGAAANTSNSIAAVVRNTRGVIRRGIGTGRDNDDSENVEKAEDGVSISDSLDIDAASGADDDWSVPAGPGGRKAVWQLYTQPKTPDGSLPKSLDANQQQPTNTTAGGGKSYLPFSRSQGSLRSLTKQNSSIKKANSQTSLNTYASVSQRSLNFVSAATTVSESGLVKKHLNSESITSLASIPEVEGSSHPYTIGSYTAASSSSSVASSLQPSVAPHLTLLHQSKASLDLSLWSEALLSGLARSAELNSSTIREDEREMVKENKGKDRDIQMDEGVVEDRLGVKGIEKGKNENELESPLTTARPFEHPAQTTNTNRNMSATATRRQQPTPTAPRYPVPARPILASNNNNASSSTSSPLSHPHYHHGYGQSPKPPPAVPLPPPPFVPTTSNSNNNTIPASALMARRGIFSPPPASVPVTAANFSPLPSANPSQSLKSPISTTSPDSAQIWSEIETMMDPGMMQGMGLTSAGVEMGTGGITSDLPPKGPFKTAGEAGGGTVLGLAQAQAFCLPAAGLEIITTTSAPIQTVADLVGSSPDPSAALTESFSPILPFSPEEERVAATRVLRAGEGVLGTKTHSQGGEWKNLEESEDGRCDSRCIDGRNLEDNGEGSSGGNYNYGDREEPLIHISKAPGSADRLLIPNNQPDQANRDSSHSSSSTLTAEEVAAATTIVRKVSIARRAGVVMLKGGVNANTTLLSPAPGSSSNNGIRSLPSPATESKHPPSPLSSYFGNSSEESAGSLSLSPSSPSQDNYPTPATDSASLASPLLYYLDGTQTPSPQADKMAFGALPLSPVAATKPRSSRMNARNEGGVNDYDYNYSPHGDDEDEDGVPFTFPDETTVEAVRASMAAAASAPRPTIVISDEPHSATLPTAATTNIGTAPLSPFQQYRGWLSAVVAPLEEFIDEAVDPRDHYLDLKEIAEGESGSVFSACLNPVTASKLRLSPAIKAKDAEEMSQYPEQLKLVAIKSVAIVPSGSPKLVDLQRELTLMKGLGHENVLGMDGVYVDLVEDSLWVRMELMERSLADMVGLVGDGLMLQDRMLARFASDVRLFFFSAVTFG